MIELHPQVIEKDGKKEFVVLPFEEFVQLEEELAEYQDLQMLRAAKQEEGEAPTLSLSEVKAELGIGSSHDQTGSSLSGKGPRRP